MILASSLPVLGFLPTALHSLPCSAKRTAGLSVKCIAKDETSSFGEERRGVLEKFGAVVGGLAMMPLAANADTCSRKDCQPQANFLPEGDKPKKSDFTQKMGALEGKDYGKTKMKFTDYTQTETGLQFKDAKLGTGETPSIGDRVVFDWEGYTIGYYGRIFQAKGRVQGGAFADETDFYRAVIGSGKLVPGLEEGIKTMKVGGIRQIVVPPEIGYPDDDPSHERVGPRPVTFDGQRALDFVLRNNGLIDKTLLFNVKLVRVDKPDATGAFTRGDSGK